MVEKRDILPSFDEEVRLATTPTLRGGILGLVLLGAGIFGALAFSGWMLLLMPLGFAVAFASMYGSRTRIAVTEQHVIIGPRRYPREWLVPFATAPGEITPGTTQVWLANRRFTADDALVARLAAALSTVAPTRLACSSHKLTAFIFLAYGLWVALSLMLNLPNLWMSGPQYILPLIAVQGTRVLLHLGGDGFAMKLFFRTTFVPWARVREVRLDKVIIEFRDGASALSLRGAANVQASAKCVVARLQQAHAAYLGAEQSRTVFDELPEDVNAWMPRLRELAASPETAYRVQPLDDDACAAAAANPLLAPEKRAAALLVLRMRAPSDERVRVAVDAAAEPRLRVTMEEIANQEPEQAEAALSRYLTGARR